MAARTFDIARNIIFLVAICILCCFIHKPYDNGANHTFFDYYRDRDSSMRNDVLQLTKTLIGNEEEISYVWTESESRGYLRPSKKAQQIDSALTRLRSHLTEQYINQANVDGVQAEFEKCITWILGFLPMDSSAMRPVAWSPYYYDFYKAKKGQWLKAALFTEPLERRGLILESLKIRLNGIQCMVLKRMCELTVDRCCFCSDSAIMLAAPVRTNYNVGDRVDKDFILVAVPHYRYRVENYFGQQLLRSGSYRTGKLIARCSAPGDYEVSGFSRVRWYRGVWDTLPWSFKYRVIGKGASLTLNAHQYCYRHVPNPVTLYIPGYPPDKIRLWSKHAKLVHKADAQWDIVVADTSLDSVIVYADATDVHGHTATVHAVAFTVKDLDDLKLYIDGEERTTMPAKDLLKAQTLSAISEVSGISVRVISYELVIINAQNKLAGIFMVDRNGINESNSELRNALSALTPGCHIYLSNVLAEHNIPVPGAGITIE